MTAQNPYLVAVPTHGHTKLSRSRLQLEPFIAEHMEGFGAALEGRCSTPEQQVKRVKAHTYMRMAHAAAEQALYVAQAMAQKANPLMGPAAFEAALGSSTLQAQITDFITQAIHMTLDIFPRLLSTQLVSMQPFTQPNGYVFWLERLATDDGDRLLSALSTFDSTMADRSAEGAQVTAVGVQLRKELVEVTWHALMRQHSWEAEVALRSQYQLDLGALGDLTVADELAWEIDRQVVDAVTTFAATNTRGIKYFDDDAGGSYSGYTPSEQQAYDKRIVSRAISEVEIEMSADVFRRPNWWICGINFAKVLARTPEQIADDQNNATFDQTMTKGSLIASGRMTTGAPIWTDPQLDADTAVCGYVDNMNPFYAGYIVSPFGMSSLLTAAFMDPDVLLEKRSRALAYAKKGVRAQQFRQIKLGTAS